MHRWLALPLLLLAPACQLGGAPPTIHYYSADTTSTAPSPESETSGIPLRLRRITAAGHVKERLVWRIGDNQYRFEELARWTELPVAYLERSLARELYERRALRRSESAFTPRLDVNLIAFEAVEGPQTTVQATAVVSLLNAEGEALFEHTLTTTARSTSPQSPDVADALAKALGEMVTEIGDKVVEALGQE